MTQSNRRNQKYTNRLYKRLDCESFEQENSHGIKNSIHQVNLKKCTTQNDIAPQFYLKNDVSVDYNNSNNQYRVITSNGKINTFKSKN